MAILLFNPFDNLNLNSRTCFLTGRDLHSDEEQVCIFPDWILDRFSLRDKKFKMMDQVTGIRYEDLKLPCSPEVRDALTVLDEEIREAFAKGYKGVKNIPEERLFLWMGKTVYGVLYHDLCMEISRSARNAKARSFALSDALKKKFARFHLMLQSLVALVEFKGTRPWSIRIVQLKYSKDTFNYKDEPINLNFSLGMNGFGIVACLMDNGAVATRQQDIIDKIGDKILHPIQFEELCARFLYTNYLLKKQPKYHIQLTDEKVTIESFPLTDDPAGSLFARWDDDMFAQVLTGYWEPWGFAKNEIINLPDSPISFLENDYTYEFIEPDSFTLPY